MVVMNSSSIIAQTSERDEEGIKLYSGGIYAISASQKEGIRTTTVTSGVELRLEIFKNDLDRISPQSFSLFSNLTQILNHQPPQSRFGLKASKALNWQRFNFTLNLEGSSRQWREEEDGALFTEAYGAGSIKRHQFEYKAILGSRFKLTERSEIRVDASAGRQLHYAQGDRVKHLAGLKYEASRVLSHEVTLSRSYFLGKSPALGTQKETIQALEVISSLKIDEIEQLRCNGGWGEIHATARSAQRFYSGGCLAERRGRVLKQSIELTRSIDKDFFSGDFIESDKLEMGLARDLGIKDRVSSYLAYVIDRDVGDPFWGNKKRLDTTFNLLTQLDGLKSKTGIESPYALTSVTWSFENTGFKRQGQVYQIGIGAHF